MPWCTLEVEFQRNGLTPSIHQLESVYAVTVHVRDTNPACPHPYTGDQHIGRFGVCAKKSKARSASCTPVTALGLLAVNEIGNLNGIADERRSAIDSDQIPVALLGVELHCEAARIARLLGRPAITP